MRALERLLPAHLLGLTRPMHSNSKTQHDLATLIASLDPKLDPETYVFSSRSGVQYGDLADLHPLGCILEEEGLSLILEQQQADRNGLAYTGAFKRITLTVQSSLEAVGLTAVVSQALAEHDLPTNVVAGTYHDHLFIPERFAHQAMTVLVALQTRAFASSNEQD